MMSGASTERTPSAGGRSPHSWRRVGPAALALSLVCVLCLSGCDPVVDGGGTVVTELVKERSFDDAVEDLTIRAELNHLFFQDDVELYQDVSFSVVEGRVLLKGSVTTAEDRVHAQQLAWQVDGVLEVINEIQVSDESGILNFVRDTWISAQLKAKLLADTDIMSLNYDVETVNGTIYLFGIARSEDELALVLDHARSIEDVTRIVSHVVMKDDPRRSATP